MNIFDDEAIEDAARAGIFSTVSARIVLNAAFKSMIERGRLEAFTPSGSDCHPESVHASFFRAKLPEATDEEKRNWSVTKPWATR